MGPAIILSIITTSISLTITVIQVGVVVTQVGIVAACTGASFVASRLDSKARS